MADRRGRLRRLEDRMPRRRPRTRIRLAGEPLPEGFDPRYDRLLEIVGIAPDHPDPWGTDRPADDTERSA